MSNYSREMLVSKPKNELEEICKQLNLPRYKGKTKLPRESLIESILSCPGNENVETPNEVVEEVVETKTEEVKEEVVKNEPIKIEFKDRTVNIENAEPGTIMCFVDLKGKPRTAALVNRSSKRREVKLVTEFGWEFIVPYENVLWVREGTRWPRAIFRILKEYGKNVQKTNN